MTDLLVTLWQPLAAILVLILGGLGLYAKGKADARQKAKSEATTARLKTVKEVQTHAREAETQDDDALVARLTRKP